MGNDDAHARLIVAYALCPLPNLIPVPEEEFDIPVESPTDVPHVREGLTWLNLGVDMKKADIV